MKLVAVKGGDGARMAGGWRPDNDDKTDGKVELMSGKKGGKAEAEAEEISRAAEQRDATRERSGDG